MVTLTTEWPRSLRKILSNLAKSVQSRKDGQCKIFALNDVLDLLKIEL